MSSFQRLRSSSLGGWPFFSDSPKIADVPRFPTTRWSAVLEARSDDAAARERAWNVLARAYYKPSYMHVRVHWNKSPEDAEDLTQAFFERAVEKSFFRDYQRDRTRFRSYLRMCLDRFVSNQDKAKRRLKRGGDRRAVTLDFGGVEEELERAMRDGWAAPDSVFDREYDRTLLALSVDALRKYCEDNGKLEHFVIFERYDLCAHEERPSYAELAEELDLPATTVTNRLSWARRRFRSHVLETLEQLTADAAEYRDEVRRLAGSSDA